MEQEITYLSKVTEHPEPPVVAILGGAKVSDKIPLLPTCSTKSRGCYWWRYGLHPVAGAGLCRGGFAARTRLCRTGQSYWPRPERQVQLVLPSDHVIAQALEADTPTRTVAAEGIRWPRPGYCPQTVQRFRDIIWRHVLSCGMDPWGCLSWRHFAREPWPSLRRWPTARARRRRWR